MRTRTEIVAHATKILSNFTTLAQLCDELAKIDDLDRAMSKAQQQYDTMLAGIARLDEINAAIETKTAELMTLEKRVSKLRGEAGQIAGAKGAR